MPIKKRKIPPSRRAKVRVKKRLQQTRVTDADLARMGELLAAGHGTKTTARIYFKYLYERQLDDLQSIAAMAEEQRSWKFMEGALMQATDLYVLSSILYEKFPEHVFMTDTAFDQLSRFLLKHFKELPKDFREWYTITTIDLKAGTGMAVTVQNNIRWMVFLLTGNWMEKSDEPARPRILRKRKIIRRKSKTKGK